MKKLINNKGSILIISYFVLYALITLSVGLALFNFGELNFSRRYKFSVQAFWLAEAGINLFMSDTGMLDKAGSKIIKEKEGTIYLTKDDSNPLERVVTATGVYGGIKRSVQVTYPSNAPEVFRNTLSVKGDIQIVGNKSSLLVNDKTRVSGRIRDAGKHSTIFFEDTQESVDPRLVSLTYPDSNQNGVADEFNDFVKFNQELIKNYPKDEILYIKGDGTYTITPSSKLEGKKIVYVEGSSKKSGNVIIQFGGSLKKDQKLTVIATGNVTYNQGGWAPSSSQLNIISWGGYTETAALPGRHNGVIFTHGVANFDDIYETSVTSGAVAANGGMTIREIWSNKTFNFADMRDNDTVPPGFEGVMGGGTTGYADKPNSWRAI